MKWSKWKSFLKNFLKYFILESVIRFIYLMAVLGIELRTLYMLGMQSTIELYPPLRMWMDFEDRAGGADSL